MASAGKTRVASLSQLYRARTFKKVGFRGRPYLLRTFADRLFYKTLSDEDLKEFMLGHKGKISAIYQFRGLTTEDRVVYRKALESNERFVNEKILGQASNEEITQAQVIANFAKSMGASDTAVHAILTALEQTN